MRLAGEDGSELEMHVVGYQFPDVDADPWDSNSLLVSVRAVSPDRAWEAVDPCLTTWEAANLVRWLAGVAAGNEAVVTRSFTEPNVTMAVRAATPDLARFRVRACFALESRPPWLPGPAHGDEALCLDLDVHRSAFGRAAVDLARELRRFPQRGDDPTV